MRKVNPYERFFTRNLYPESTGVVDAFWGFHAANNIGRLLNCDGTVVFDGRLFGMESPTSIALIPVGNMNFHSAPIVQLAAYQEYETTTSTVYAVGTQSYGTLVGFLIDMPFTQAYFSTLTTIPAGNSYWRAGDSFFGKIGTRYDELIKFKVIVMAVSGQVYTGGPSTGEQVRLDFVLECQRGWFDTTARQYNQGEALFEVGPQSYSRGQTGARTFAYSHSPSWVDARLSGDVLRIDWLAQSRGTCYFKIFGA